MPALPQEDFRPLPIHRRPYRSRQCTALSEIGFRSGMGYLSRLFLCPDRAGFHRSGSPHSARSDHVERYLDRRACQCLPRATQPAYFANPSSDGHRDHESAPHRVDGKPVRNHCGRRLAVGCSRSLLAPARHRRHGFRRRQNDGHGGRLSRGADGPADDHAGIIAGVCDRFAFHALRRQGARLRAAFRDIPRPCRNHCSSLWRRPRETLRRADDSTQSMNVPFSAQITNKMPSGLITVDREGRITGHNPACERIFLETLVTSDLLRDLVRESQALQELLNRCLEAGEVFTRVQFNVPTRSGVDKRIGINLSPITSPEGRIEGAICLLSDLTEIVELQNQIKLKDNFAALGEMSASIAHEFKNSLATIVGYAEMSTTETDLQTLQNYAREIHKESQGLSHMVTDFLNFARPVMTAIYPVDLAELLGNVISDLRNLRPGTYDVRLTASGNAVVPCDATLIRQSFLNLLINAVDALT